MAQRSIKRRVFDQRRTNRNEADYKLLLLKCWEHGMPTMERSGVGTRMLTNQLLTLDMEEMPLFTGKWINHVAAEEELKLYLRGITNNEVFMSKGINYWKGFAKPNGELGPIYGSQWIDFNGDKINQIQQAIDTLNTDPYSRRIIITCWNPSKLDKMALPPCPITIQFNMRGKKLDMLVHQRSADAFIGVPFDIYQHYLLARYVLEHIKDISIELGNLSFIYGNFHIYKNHIPQVIEYLCAPVHKAPHIVGGKVRNYKHGKYIKGAINGQTENN